MASMSLDLGANAQYLNHWLQTNGIGASWSTAGTGYGFVASCTLHGVKAHSAYAKFFPLGYSTDEGFVVKSSQPVSNKKTALSYLKNEMWMLIQDTRAGLYSEKSRDVAPGPVPQGYVDNTSLVAEVPGSSLNRVPQTITSSVTSADHIEEFLRKRLARQADQTTFGPKRLEVDDAWKAKVRGLYETFDVYLTEDCHNDYYVALIHTSAVVDELKGSTNQLAPLAILGDAAIKTELVQRVLRRGTCESAGIITGLCNGVLSNDNLAAKMDLESLSDVLIVAGGKHNLTRKTPADVFEAMAGACTLHSFWHVSKFVDKLVDADLSEISTTLF